MTDASNLTDLGMSITQIDSLVTLMTWAIIATVTIIIIGIIIRAFSGIGRLGESKSDEEEEEEDEDEEEEEQEELWCNNCEEEIEDNVYECTYCHEEFCEDCITKKVTSHKDLYLCNNCLNKYNKPKTKKKKMEIESTYKKTVKPIDPKEFE